jgi:p-methyltransferase
MSGSIPCDCILVGYNDVDFDAFASTQQIMARYSGAYHEIKTNSIIWRGRRVPYMELMNQAITVAIGRNPRLSVFEAPLQALCYLGNHLRKQGFSVKLVNFFNHEKDKFRSLLLSGPRAVAITTTFYVDNAPVIELIEFVRKYCPETKVIVGGPHILNLASDHDQDTQKHIFETVIGADIYIIESQGEATLSQLIGQLRGGRPLDVVPNLYYRSEDGSFRRTERVVENNDLSQNSIDWRSFDKDFLSNIAYVRTARSCPYTCSFCNYPTMAGAYVNSSLEAVENELKGLRERGVTDVVFIDDTFNYPLQRFKRLLRMMIVNEFGFRWVSFLRCSNVDEEAIDLMRQSGCVGVLLGIESGDQRILQLMNKSAKVDRYRWGIAELNKQGIASFASLICGFPGETEESVNNTMSFIEESKPTFYNVQLYYHDERAPIQKQANQFGIRGAGYSWSHNSMDWKTAASLAEFMIRSIESSIPLPLYGFSLWGISYLISKGISMEQIKEFGRITKPILLKGLTEDYCAVFKAEEERLVSLFR